MNHIGPIVAVGCALTWSIAVICFRIAGDHLHATTLNLLKNTLGLVLLIPTLYFFEGNFILDINQRDLFLLLGSGALGIGIADALVLKSLSQIGASRFAIVETCYSPYIILLSAFYLGEDLTWPRLIGMGLVVTAIVIVNAQRLPPSENVKNIGILWGGLGIFAMAIGIVAIKPIFATVGLLWIITIRMFAGVVASFFTWLVKTSPLEELRRLRTAPHKFYLYLACILSTYISMIMWVAGFKYNDAMVTAVLNQTTTIFTVLLAAFILRERLTKPKIAGTLLATLGAIIIATH